MAALKIVLTVLHLVIAFGLVVSVLFQSGKSQGLSGTIAGGAETFFGKNKGKTLDGILAKVTVVLAILFVATAVSLSAIERKLSEAEVDAPAISQDGEASVEGGDIEIIEPAEGEEAEAPAEGEEVTE